MPAEASENLALRVQVMPRDTNPLGTVFGGVILSLIDQAGFDEARRHGLHRWVTVAFHGVEFKRPVRVGDRVSLFTKTLSTGRSSVEIGVRVEAHRFQSDEVVEVTSGSLTMVSIDKHGKSIPFSDPPTLETPRDQEP
ncbi:MAG: hotdog domain-containing protein [Phycisphaerales bacterium]|nr:hotdog domain-containing protein [Phycisphaerales bacterium]